MTRSSASPFHVSIQLKQLENQKTKQKITTTIFWDSLEKATGTKPKKDSKNKNIGKKQETFKLFGGSPKEKTKKTRGNKQIKFAKPKSTKTQYFETFWRMPQGENKKKLEKTNKNKKTGKISQTIETLGWPPLFPRLLAFMIFTIFFVWFSRGLVFIS